MVYRDAAAAQPTRKKHERRLHAADVALWKAHEEYYVAIREASLEGLTNADMAYILGGLSPSTVANYGALGEQILELRDKGEPVTELVTRHSRRLRSKGPR